MNEYEAKISKKKLVIFFIIVSFSLTSGVHSSSYKKINNQPSLSEDRVIVFDLLLSNLNVGNLSVSEKSNLIDTFFLEQTPLGFPIVNNKTAVFVYRGSAMNVYVAGDFNSWSPSNSKFKLKNLAGTNLFYLKQDFETDARLDYKYVADSNWILDSNNNKTVSGGFGPNSELVMPSYFNERTYLYQTNIGGKIISLGHFKSLVQDNWTHSINVYLPYGYDPNTSTRYKSFYTSDGSEYINLGSAKNTMDYLINQGIIPPLIGVFVDPVSVNWRLEEYNNQNCVQELDTFGHPGQKNICRQKYAEFLATELVPYIDSNYKTNTSASARALIGDSLGGQISIFTASQYPSVFKLIGSHSGAFWVDLSVIRYFNQTNTFNGRFYVNAGTYEPSILAGTKELAEILEHNYYDAKFRVFHQGHSWGQWRSTFAEMLRFLYTQELSDYSGSPALSPTTSTTSPTTSTSAIIVSSTEQSTQAPSHSITTSQPISTSTINISDSISFEPDQTTTTTSFSSIYLFFGSVIAFGMVKKRKKRK